jgi:SAM-dependent methyltransferase
MSVYDCPKYYEIAFSYQEVKRQVDYFETLIAKYCRRKARRFLDIACGPSPQLREIARRGYEAVGLDANTKMLSYLSRKAEEEGLAVETVQADMQNFRLAKRCDFAFTLSGSLVAGSNQELLKHLRCVADALNDGGLYLLENLSIRLATHVSQDWVMKSDGIEIKTVFEANMVDPMRQVSQSKLTLEVDDHGKRLTLVNIEKTKSYAPAEFESLVEVSGCFRFLEFFKHLTLEPLAAPSADNIVLMQKTER